LLTAAWAVGISIPANAAPTKGSLEIVSVANSEHEELGLLVQGQTFDVKVRVLDTDGQPTTVNQATGIRLEAVSGPGNLGGNTTATISRNDSSTTIEDATYSKFANGVVLRVRATSGVQLDPDQVTVNVALTAVSKDASRGQTFNLDDPECGDGGGVPTSGEPTCGRLLTKGAAGLVVMSVGSCDGLGCDKGTLVVTINADIQPTQADPFSTLILSCDKALCGGSGVPKIPVFYTFNNDGDLLPQAAPACPAKGVLGDKPTPEDPICADYVQSTRSAGDLFIYVLFAHDVRMSF
jgi:hypothetical protein